MTADKSIPISTNIDLQVQDLGRMTYTEALERQRSLQQQVIAARDERRNGQPTVMHLLLVEHDPPVITISRRKTARQNLVATNEQLQKAGVEIAETDRGGDITYHGPGQLVVYPIFDLNVLNLRLHNYMRFLEHIVIDVLAKYNIKGQRDTAATGVWVNTQNHNSNTSQDENPQQLQKICAMGVRVSRWVSMHGLALNVNTNLAHFQLIVPCGLVGRQVTTMYAIHALRSEKCPTMNMVKQTMIDCFRTSLDLQ